MSEYLSQAGKILKALRAAGDKGVENYKLARLSLKYSCRITELRQEGYSIIAERQMVRGRWTGTWKYYLTGEDN